LENSFYGGGSFARRELFDSSHDMDRDIFLSCSKRGVLSVRTTTSTAVYYICAVVRRELNTTL
jgi:hypothetical protein